MLEDHRRKEWSFHPARKSMWMDSAKTQSWTRGSSRTARDKKTILNQAASPKFSGFHIRIQARRETVGFK